MRRTPIIIAAILIAPILMGVLYYILLSVFGYYVDDTGWEVAEILVKEGKDVQECYKIRIPLNFPIPGPTEGEQKALCIYEYAKLSKDPTACKNLMPSDYGLGCISAAFSEVVTEEHCSEMNEELNCAQQTPSYWSQLPPDHKITKYPLPLLSGCDVVEPLAVRGWCYSESIRKGLSGVEVCEKLPAKSQVRDLCHHSYAQKIKEQEACESIQRASIKTACKMLVKAKKEHPELFNNNK